MKKYILVISSLLPMMAFADGSSTCGDNVTWTYVNATKTLTISGSGEMKNYDYDPLPKDRQPWYSYRKDIQKIIIESGVTSIGNYAFEKCGNVTDITIPNSVITIGKDAFQYCISLTSVTIPNNVTKLGADAFNGCRGLTSVIIGNSVTSIEPCAFMGCSSLTSVTIGNSVTSIGGRAFEDCSSLTTITIPNNVTSIKYRAFADCTELASVTIPNSVTNIENEAFSGTAWLNNQPDGLVYAGKVVLKYKGTMPDNTTIKIDEGTLGIAERAFIDCNGLTSVTIPNSVTSIGINAFNGCTNLTSVTIPNNVTSIGDAVFYNCSGLTSITIPNSVTSIGESAFYGCSGLTSIAIPNGVISIGGSAFRACSSLTSVIICCSPTSIGDYVFKECTNIKDVIFDCETVASLFNGFSSIEKVKLSEKVTSVENSAFKGWSGLTSAELHCKTIGAWLKGKTSLKEITIGNEVTSITSDAFYGCYGLTVNISDLSSWCNISFGNYSANPCGNLLLNGKEITNLVIPDGVTSIGEYAFAGCLGLTSVTIPNSVESIGESAFRFCSSLTSLTISNSVKSINSYVFQDCAGLTNVDIPNSVESIGYCAFSGCSNLNILTIPNSVKNIGVSAFANCYSLSSLIIPNSVTSIGAYAFENCRNLSSLTIPNSVTSIGDNAFYHKIVNDSKEWYNRQKRELTVYISDLVSWCNIDFGNNVFYGISDNYRSNYDNLKSESLDALQRYSLCLKDKNLTELEIPKSVTEIKKNAFAFCSTTIKLHDGITKIGDNAFRFGYVNPSSGFKGVKQIGDYAFEYSNLSSIEFGNGLTSIGKYGFANTNIESIVLPNTIISIGEWAFEECHNLKYAIFTSECLPTFTYSPNYTFQVVVPQDTYEKGIPESINNFETYSNTPMFVDVKSKGATSAVLDVYPINDDGSLDEKNMATVTTVGQTPGQYLNWKLDKDNYGIISEKANETLTLTVLEPKALSTKKARLLATAEEEADDLEHYGFEWRRYEAPDGVPSSKVSSPLYNGQIVGTLNNLNPDAYYKYRPFYKSESGEMFYGEWMGLFTGDADVFFEPEVYTKDAADITKVSALLAGVWFEGTDDFQEKGFEYWTVTGSKTRGVGSDAKKVVVSGNAMTATLEGLKAGATYGYRSYVKTTSGSTTYGEEKTFQTILIGDVDGDGKLTNADADAIAKHIIGQTPSGFNKKMADVNEDNHINIIDIVLLVKMIE